MSIIGKIFLILLAICVITLIVFLTSWIIHGVPQQFNITQSYENQDYVRSSDATSTPSSSTSTYLTASSSGGY